jgi:hypothetical protein
MPCGVGDDLGIMAGSVLAEIAAHPLSPGRELFRTHRVESGLPFGLDAVAVPGVKGLLLGAVALGIFGVRPHPLAVVGPSLLFPLPHLLRIRWVGGGFLTALGVHFLWQLGISRNAFAPALQLGALVTDILALGRAGRVLESFAHRHRLATDSTGQGPARGAGIHRSAANRGNTGSVRQSVLWDGEFDAARTAAQPALLPAPEANPLATAQHR